MDWLLDLTFVILDHNLQSSSTFHARQSTIRVLSLLRLLSLTSPLIPASNGGRFPSWVPKFSPRYNHSCSWLTVHSLTTYRSVFSCHYLYGKVYNNYWCSVLSSKVEVTLRLTVSQYVLMSNPFWFSWPDVCYCFAVTVVSLWGALSDERSSLQFASMSCSSSSSSYFATDGQLTVLMSAPV
jgi:hypothetical protein